MDKKKWLEGIGRIIDKKDANEFVNFLTEDCTFRFGNHPAVEGKKATKEYVDGFFSLIAGCEHKIVNLWEKKDSVVWQGEVKYKRLDNKKVTVNFVNIFYLRGGLIKDYLIYIDNSPLFEK